METITIVGVFFLGVFSYRFVAGIMNFSHLHKFFVFCFACCLTLIRTHARNVAEVKRRLLHHMEETGFPEEKRKELERKIEATLHDWRAVSFVHTMGVIPKEFTKVLKFEEISDRLASAFKEVEK
jgi:hypothetical protein